MSYRVKVYSLIPNRLSMDKEVVESTINQDKNILEYQEPLFVKCGCGCGEEILLRDSKHRLRKGYVKGHNQRYKVKVRKKTGIEVRLNQMTREELISFCLRCVEEINEFKKQYPI